MSITDTGIFLTGIIVSMAKDVMNMRSYSSLGMKFLLAIGLFSTAFSVFLIYRTWKDSHESLQQMLGQQAELSMAFEVAMEAVEWNDASPAGANPENRKEGVRRVFERVQDSYPHVILHAEGEQLEKILSSRAGLEGLKVYDLFESDSSLETVDLPLKFSGRDYLAKFRIARSDAEAGDPRSSLRMVAIPLAGYRSKVNEQVMSRFPTLMFALLGLFGAIYCSFELLVGRRVRRIAGYFQAATNQRDDFCFTPLPTGWKDEIGLLANSFNCLGEKLENLYKTLDSKVRERTFLLQQTNKRLRDKISECQQTEANAKILAHEAIAANRAKSEFLANMSHELRTPMNAIMGFSQVLSEENMKEEHKTYIDMIERSGKSLLELINDILDYSKIESGKLEIEIRDCRIGDMIADVESMLRPSAIQKRIGFEVLQCDPVPETIRTDSLRLRQCLVNLVSNAIKFTEEGHVYVNITTPRYDDTLYIRFDVEDTGIGIPGEKISTIFDSFTQADSATTRKYGGTGLGLSITQRLVELMGGHISVDSVEGAGSVFTIEVPTGVQWPDTGKPDWNKYLTIDQINEVDTTEIEKGSAMYAGKILVAEDNPSNQKLIGILLQKMGLEVTLADDGIEAIKKCEAETFDIILMDMQMPNMNGYDAVRHLRSQGVKTPIIAVTANAMTGDEKKCLDAGCDGYLSKPIDRNKLDALIGQHLSVQVG